MSFDDSYHLLANPFHLKKKEKKIDIYPIIDDNIFNILHKKYPGIVVNDNDKPLILEKIESILIENTSKNIINSLIDKVLFDQENESILSISN
ncbi:MAG: hypothetical protein CMH79_04740 [Nitrospinae bacterium]|nr:hypothetical protein [Nitrospinota bacterium]|tara:strand:+ start:783 stop:1061 length:279 start_codon:yes stop_codon:yes gene_type:complete